MTDFSDKVANLRALLTNEKRKFFNIKDFEKYAQESIPMVTFEGALVSDFSVVGFSSIFQFIFSEDTEVKNQDWIDCEIDTMLFYKAKVNDILFSRCTFKNFTISESEFSKVIFQDCVFNNIDIIKSKLSSCSFINCHSRAPFTLVESELKEIAFPNSSLDTVTIIESKLEDIKFDEIESDLLFSGLDIGDDEISFNNANLRSVNLDECFIKSVDFSKFENIRDISFTYCDVENSEFSFLIKQEKMNLIFGNSDIKFCNFEHTEARLISQQSILTNCFFQSCDITESSFKDTTFNKCDFSKAKLKNGSFNDVNIKFSNFSKVDMPMSIIKNNIWLDSDFSGANLKNSQVDILIDSGVIWEGSIKLFSEKSAKDKEVQKVLEDKNLVYGPEAAK